MKQDRGTTCGSSGISFVLVHPGLLAGGGSQSLLDCHLCTVQILDIHRVVTGAIPIIWGDVYGSCSLSHSLPEWKCVILNVLTQFYFWNYCLPVANSSLLCLSELSLWLLIILWQVPLVALTLLEKGNSVL